MQLLETASGDVIERLSELKGTDLLEFFRSFHWNKCLRVLLLNLSDGELRALLESIIDALPEDIRDVVTVGDTKEGASRGSSDSVQDVYCSQNYKKIAACRHGSYLGLSQLR